MKIDKIKITGQELPKLAAPVPEDSYLELRVSYLVGHTTRGEMVSYDVELKDDEIAEIVFEDGTSWFASSYTLQEALDIPMSVSDRAGESIIELPTEIRADSAERGFVSNIALKIFNIFAKKAGTAMVDFSVKNLAARLEDRQLDEKIGLFRLGPNFELEKFSPSAVSKPYCLLIHGTAASTESSFGDVRGSELMKYLSNTYEDRILAFQHRSLTENPVQNVLALMKQLPDQCTLHLITTSKGGLLGEVLSRFCSVDGDGIGFTRSELEILRKNYPLRYFDSLVTDIESIRELERSKKIVVEKFIRIACPAGGTILASNRLDHLFNITFNLLGLGTGLSTNPVYIAFKNLIAAVIDTKNKVDVLPGIEVQHPASPFIKALNSAVDPTNPSSSVVINNSLVVIAGNTKPALRFSALLIIASKLFFEGKNDLIVNTDSMASGTRRKGMVQQFLYEETDINHFRYMSCPRTKYAVKSALETKWGEKIPEFTEQLLSETVTSERNILLKLEMGELFPTDASGSKPIVVLLPGIMGSNLSLDDTLLWINYPRFIFGGLRDLANQNVRATSLVAASYRKLTKFLQETYDVVVFPFDWRKPMKESARLLDLKLQDLMKTGQPVKLIGHSMGGVLIRDYMKLYPTNWQNLNRSAGFRLIFLGSPLKGSFRIPAVLMGKDSIIHKLNMIDRAHSVKELLQIFSKFKGLLGLLPFTKQGEYDFGKVETWVKLREGIGEVDWPLPTAEDLKEFADYREAMCDIMTNEDLSNAVYIAGQDKVTPSGYYMHETPAGKDLVFLCTGEGDASVTWDSGIPANLIEKDRVYYVDVTHGSLANEPDMFKGVREILETGSTSQFTRTRPLVKTEEKVFISSEYRDFDLSQYGLENTLLGLGSKPQPVARELPIRVSVSLGDLKYARYPTLAGHFENDGVLFAEKAIDDFLGGILSQHHKLDIYPGSIGSNDIFLPTHSVFKGAIIIGLGKPGELSGPLLTSSVEQGVANYLLYLSKAGLTSSADQKTNGLTGISSLIVGCGYGGLSIETSIKAIVQGVFNANLKIRNLKLENPKTIEHIEFIELYEDKAISSFITVSRIEKDESSVFRIIREGDRIKSLLGHKKRIPLDSSEGWWNRISVEAEGDDKSIRKLVFKADTSSSREEKQDLLTTPALMEEIISEMSTNHNWTADRAKAIFELLIPNDFKDKLKRHGNIIWSVDTYSAGYPWELLQEGLSDSKPMCISSGMIRQLSTMEYRKQIRTVPRNKALIIADPQLGGYCFQLPGARQEGEKVAELFAAEDIPLEKSINETHIEIIRKMFSDEYKYIHLSGHGSFNKEHPEESGMVIGKKLFLSTREIQQMSTSPELVFVNCCHLGKSDSVAEELYQQRFRLAANIGIQLINNGVKCVIAAGWAVDDSAALLFAEVFYKKMFCNNTFGESVHAARKAVYEKFGEKNTWGAYQCYGDPFYRFEHRRGASSPKELNYLLAREAEIDLDNLLSDIEIGKQTSAEFIEKLKRIITAVDKTDIRNSLITEKEAFVYLETGDYDQACNVFGKLLSREDTSYSFSAIERFYNVRAKKTISDYLKEVKNNETKNSVDKKNYLEQINKVIDDFQTLFIMSQTPDRFNMLGSTYKRQAFLLTENDKLRAYKQAAYAYYRGYKLHPKWYALTNWLAIEESLVLVMQTRKTDLNAENVPIGYQFPGQKESIEMLDRMKPDPSLLTEDLSYWDLVSEINIRLCKYIIEFDPDKGPSIQVFASELSELWKMAGSKGKRFAEIEHLEFLIDILSTSKNRIAGKLSENLIILKNILEKIV